MSLLCSSGFAFSPLKLANNMDEIFYSKNGAVFRVAYSSMNVGKYSKVIGVDVPTSFILNNLSVVVYVRNITDRELNLANTKLPFEISAKSFALTLQGKEQSVKFVSDSAWLTPINTIILKGGVRVYSNKKSVYIGEKASLMLKGRMLYLSFSGEKMAFKF